MIKKNVADLLVDTLVAAGVNKIYGLAGDSLNGITDSIRTRDNIQWIPFRHEETAAFAAGADAHLTGKLALCAGSCGPGNLHLINGLYDCHRSRVPVVAIAAQIPSNEIGSGYFRRLTPSTSSRNAAITANWFRSRSRCHASSKSDELLLAARESGFASVELLDEPVAAGIAFMRGARVLWPEGAVMVLDWGAGTLDLAVLTTKDGRPRIVPDLVEGQEGLGGEDLDNHLLRMVNRRLAHLRLDRLQGRKEVEHESAHRRVIEWKIKHGTKPGAKWRMEGLSDVPADAELSWTSEEISAQLEEKFTKVADVCGALLEKARARAIIPAGLLLIGGSSQFPAFRALLERRFSELRILPWEKRLTAVALGAAWQAAARMQQTELTVALDDDTKFTLAANNPLSMNFVPVRIMDGRHVVGAVFFGEYPVRVKDYEAFVKETGRAWNRPSFPQTPDHPAVNAHWHDARAFCDWLTLKANDLQLGVRFRLPTDHEWSCAAGLPALERQNDPPATKNENPQTRGLYVWGNYWPPPYGTFAREERDPGITFSRALEDAWQSTLGVEGPSGAGSLALLGVIAVGSSLLCAAFFAWAENARRAARIEYEEKWGGLYKHLPLTSGDSGWGTILSVLGYILVLAAIAAFIGIVLLIVHAVKSTTPPRVKPGILNYPNQSPKTTPVGTHQANSLGLFDLSGNVWEWVDQDWNGASDERVLRGGAWNEYQPERLGAAFREHLSSTTQSDNIGFRCVMERIAT